GRVATSTTGLSLASLRLAPALPLKSKEYYQLIYSIERMRIITRYEILGTDFALPSPNRGGRVWLVAEKHSGVF
ncbi:MAG: hypothetical protein LBM04_12100, partial [Opitutaceae bacterium]|nr:hypothetical protein [Opitutaceae bacterium]